MFTANNAQSTCSAETQDDDGNWMPCAVKCQPYFETHIKEIVDKEVTVLEAMSGSAHTLTLVSHNTALLEGQMHKYIATRWASCTNMLSFISMQGQCIMFCTRAHHPAMICCWNICWQHIK